MKNACDTYLRPLQNPSTILIPLYISLIFHLLNVAITYAQPLSYIPKDNIAINCGYSVNKTALDYRNWEGDINSACTLANDPNSMLSTRVEPLFMQVDSIPFKDARISRYEFTYTITVSEPGPKFLRLYFFSAPYEGDDFNNPSNAFFSVKANQYTLLSNFSVSLTAKALGKPDMVKEFLVPVEKSVLNITFTPAFWDWKAFAFINGIEVVSMPNNLYYSATEGGGLNLLHRKNDSLGNNTALEKMYRINMGGSSISPTYDTGMFRKWDKEDGYLKIQEYSLPVVASVNLNFTSISTFTAPANVYLTARSMGSIEKAKSYDYNLTWEFPVDSAFTYMVRLHFCEIQPEITRIGYRTFLIYIANQAAETNADVVRWTGNQYIPYFRDYVVSIPPKEGEEKVNLSVALHVIRDFSISRYSDAILNGIEIFKLNNSNSSLAGPNPSVSAQLRPSQHHRKVKDNPTAIIGIASGVVSGVVILSVLGFLILRQWRKNENSDSIDYGSISWWVRLFSHQNKPVKTVRGSTSILLSTLCRHFSLAEMKSATYDFDESFIIGVGGFGNVYKGYVDRGTTPVAIKRLKPRSSQGAHEFETEIQILTHLVHRNLVSLLGYCNDNKEMILVYEYMERGTLRSHLFNTENPPLSWKQRLKISIGAALGLNYLHTGTNYSIIHRDVKTTNILLDEQWVAKVSDFGLSKMGPVSKSHVTTMVKGSIGYLDPEYYKCQQLTEKSDVFSFGVVLCEVLCGRPPLIQTVDMSQANLVEWFRSCYHDGIVDQIVDPNLTGKTAPESLKKYCEIAFKCTADNRTERPLMKEVVWSLELSMQLQCNWEESNAEVNNEDEIPFRYCSWDGNSGVVFSEIINLNARI
ncbi:hypothetical protein UlMin_014543 [Ulmus minor]